MKTLKWSPQISINAQKVVVITIGYIIISLFMALYDYAILSSPLSKGPTSSNTLFMNLLTNLMAGTIAGITGGTTLVTINSSYFRRKSFGFAIKLTAFAYTTIFVFIGVFMAIFYAWKISKDDSSWQHIMDLAISFLTSYAFIANFVFWGFITLTTLFLLQVNDKFGPGILLKFMLGQYYQPKEEQRIFMFLDIKSSTTIAEKIGHKAYFNLLSDFFNDITQPILNSKGEIYQYVGDEVVVSWTMENGIQHANCIHCFYKIQEKIKLKAPHYEDKYGLVPDFKAGIHHGEVTAGEIGSIKRDIVFSGDVLNTTARIQEQCNRHKVKLLISQATLSLFKSVKGVQSQNIGIIELRGRNEKIELNALQLKNV